MKRTVPFFDRDLNLVRRIEMIEVPPPFYFIPWPRRHPQVIRYRRRTDDACGLVYYVEEP